MEQIIENYYNSKQFEGQLASLKKTGMTKAECLELIKLILSDKPKLKESLDAITIHNIKLYFKELSTNDTLNDMIEESFMTIFKKTYGDGDIKDAFDKCIKNVCSSKKQLELSEKIDNDLNKFTKDYIQKYFNNIELEKKTVDLIRYNISYIIKKDYGGNIEFAIEQCITELYKKNIVDIDDNLNKVKRMCIEEGIAFEELLTATFKNIEIKMLEQSNFIIQNELNLEQERNRKGMLDYLKTIKLNLKDNIDRNVKCEKDIVNLLISVRDLNIKFEKFNDKFANTTVELIKRAVEQSVKKKFDEQLENIMTLLLEPKLCKMKTQIDTGIKTFINFKKVDFKNIEKEVISIRKLSDKHSSCISECESKLNNIEKKVNTMSCNYQDTIKQLNITHDVKVGKLENNIKDLGNQLNKLNKKYNDSEKKHNDKFNKIDNTLKSMAKQSVEVNTLNENLNENRIHKIIDEKIKSEYTKLNSTLSDNVNDIVTHKFNEFNEFNHHNGLPVSHHHISDVNHHQIDFLTQRITDLQAQITMIHQFNQLSFKYA
jgi:hypothetical protein